MSGPGFAQGVTSASYWMSHLNSVQTKTAAASTTASKTAQTSPASGDGKSFFDDVLDIVNPLQHLPIVGTVYRAVTGDKIGDVEKVAGDTLYGGPLGLASSLADVAFEKITGKDFGSTVMGWVGIGDKDKDVAVASNTAKPAPAKTLAAKNIATNKSISMPTPVTRIAQVATKPPAQITPPPAATASAAPPASAAQSVVDISPQTDALLASLQKNGVTGAMQAQALDAYRRTMTMNAQAATVH